nr:hypothetical protein ELOWGMBK_ELOWGMBK_CDS_0030 [Herelleviridae sp.]CAI9752031.1 hypothetical protein QGKEIAJE_QGKEIAJE_CDS_0029 [uncultured phage]
MLEVILFIIIFPNFGTTNVVIFPPVFLNRVSVISLQKLCQTVILSEKSQLRLFYY